jgi:hypothetical protein
MWLRIRPKAGPAFCQAVIDRLSGQPHYNKLSHERAHRDEDNLAMLQIT